LLKKLEQSRLSDEQERQKGKRQKAVEEMRQVDTLEELQACANENTKDFEDTQMELAEMEEKAQNVIDPSQKTFYREFKKVIEMADVIIEVLDARDPLGCRSKEIEQMILRKDPNKKIILLLNKIDLVPKENVEKWLKHLRNEYPTLAFKASTQMQKSKRSQNFVSAEDAPEDLLKTSTCLGAETLLQLLKNYSRSLQLKTHIRVGIIGYPNVGKSSVINSLKREKAVGVAATPGFTKTVQEVHLDKNVALLDCPGIIFSKNDQDTDIILRNCVKVEQIDDPLPAVETILNRCQKEQLLQIYRLQDYNSVFEFLCHIGKKIGKLRKGGAIDVKAAAMRVLKDWNSGRIPFYTDPPEEDKSIHIGASVVSQWAAAFNFDEIAQSEQDNVFTKLKGNINPMSLVMVPGTTSIDDDFEMT